MSRSMHIHLLISWNGPALWKFTKYSNEQLQYKFIDMLMLDYFPVLHFRFWNCCYSTACTCTTACQLVRLINLRRSRWTWQRQMKSGRESTPVWREIHFLQINTKSLLLIHVDNSNKGTAQIWKGETGVPGKQSQKEKSHWFEGRYASYR